MDIVDVAVLLREELTDNEEIVSQKDTEQDEKSKKLESEMATSLFNNEMITFNTKYRKPW